MKNLETRVANNAFALIEQRPARPAEYGTRFNAQAWPPSKLFCGYETFAHRASQVWQDQHTATAAWSLTAIEVRRSWLRRRPFQAMRPVDRSNELYLKAWDLTRPPDDDEQAAVFPLGLVGSRRSGFRTLAPDGFITAWEVTPYIQDVVDRYNGCDTFGRLILLDAIIHHGASTLKTG